MHTWQLRAWGTASYILQVARKTPPSEISQRQESISIRRIRIINLDCGGQEKLLPVECAYTSGHLFTNSLREWEWERKAEEDTRVWECTNLGIFGRTTFQIRALRSCFKSLIKLPKYSGITLHGGYTVHKDSDFDGANDFVPRRRMTMTTRKRNWSCYVLRCPRIPWSVRAATSSGLFCPRCNSQSIDMAYATKLMNKLPKTLYTRLRLHILRLYHTSGIPVQPLVQ